MKIGINTFGLGPTLHRDEKGTWEGLRRGGVSSIEPSIAVNWNVNLTEERKNSGYFDGVVPIERAEEKIRELRSMGFEVFTFHLQTSELGEETLNEVIPFMLRMGLHYCVYSFMTSSVARIRELKETILTADARLKENGLEFLIHNHNMEWKEDEGTSVMQWLLDSLPEQRFELDLGWAEYAGRSGVELLRKYPTRFPLLHFKEIAKGAEAWTDRPFCTAPGRGILPLRGLLTEVKKMPLEDRALIIDQDNSIDGDIVADYAEGVRTISALLEEL